jgi:hypothetical protein
MNGVGERAADLAQDLSRGELVRPSVGGLQQWRERRMLVGMGDGGYTLPSLGCTM